MDQHAGIALCHQEARIPAGTVNGRATAAPKTPMNQQNRFQGDAEKR